MWYYDCLLSNLSCAALSKAPRAFSILNRCVLATRLLVHKPQGFVIFSSPDAAAMTGQKEESLGL